APHAALPSCSRQGFGQAREARLRRHVRGHTGKLLGSKDARQARDEDDGTATAAHQLEGLTAAQESAAQPGVDLAVPNVSGHAGEWALDQDLRAVDQGVERLQL